MILALLITWLIVVMLIWGFFYVSAQSDQNEREQVAESDRAVQFSEFQRIHNGSIKP